MKPRTKLQKRVSALSARLPKLTQAQEAWIKRNAFDKAAYRCKKNVWCTTCGGVFFGKKTHCPHCGARLQITDSRKFKHKESVYTTIHTTCKGFQVARHFVAKRFSFKGREPRYFIAECVQIWINSDGEQTIMARPCSMSFYNDMWIWSEPLSIKRSDSGCSYYYRGNKYEIHSYTNRFCRVLPIIRRNGFRNDFHGIMPNTLFAKLLTSNTAEWLLKTGQYALLRRFCKGGEIRYPHAVNICNRNGYIVQDADIWCDYIDLLVYFRKDTHNAHYVCPKDLTGEHDRLVERKRQLEHRKEVAEKRQQIAKWEKDYQKKKGIFLGICFHSKDIFVSVLPSVRAFDMEGFVMHHCVFANEYFLKEDSIVLSAKDSNGNRLETVELNTKTWRVIQSRGRFNKETPAHDRIINLVHQNVKLFKAALSVRAKPGKSCFKKSVECFNINIAP